MRTCVKALLNDYVIKEERHVYVSGVSLINMFSEVDSENNNINMDIDSCFNDMEVLLERESESESRSYNSEYRDCALSDKEFALAADLDLVNWIEDLVA